MTLDGYDSRPRDRRPKVVFLRLMSVECAHRGRMRFYPLYYERDKAVVVTSARRDQMSLLFDLALTMKWELPQVLQKVLLPNVCR